MANWIMTNWYIQDKTPYIVIGTAGENNATSISIECDDDEIIENAEYFLDIGDTKNDIFNTQELTVKQQITPTGETTNILYLKPMRSFLGKEGVKLLQVRCEYTDNDEKVTKESNVFHAIVNKNTGFSYKFDIAIFQQYLNKVKELAEKVTQAISNLTLGELKDTNIADPTDGQIIKYDAETQKWVNSEGGGSGGSSNYNELSNKPKINNVVLSGNKTTSDLGINIPTKTSDLTNDSNFVADANYIHTDNNYTNADKTIVNGVTSALNGKVDKVNGKGLSTNDYTNTDKTIVDGVTSALASKVDSSDLASVATSGDYDDLNNKPSIPSVSVTQVLESGTKIAEIDVDGNTTDIYAPEGGGTTSALDDLTDVEITNPSSGQVLKFNGTDWVNGEGGSSTVSNDTDFIYVAHRGLYGSVGNDIPENTLEAFINALNDGFKWLEVDIRRSSDGVWVMAHDPSIDVYDSNGTATRITIAQKTLAELQTYTYDANGLYHISVFANVLCQLKKYDAKIIIDNKITSTNYEEELFDIINACGITQNAILSINVDWGLANLDILTANKKNPIRIWVDDYAKAKTLIDSIENDVYIDMNVSTNSGRNVTLPMVMALNRPIITAGIAKTWNSAQNKHAINVVAGGMTETPTTYEQMKNGLNYQIGYSDMTVSGADPYIDVATSYQITVANNNSGSGYVNIYTADPLIASTTINTIGTTSQATITAQSEGSTNAFVLNGSVCRAIRVQSAPNGFWQAGDIGDSNHSLGTNDIKAILLEFTHENDEKITVPSNVYNVMYRYNLNRFGSSYNLRMPTIPEGATKFYASFLNDVAGQFYIKFFTEDFVVTLDSQGWQSTKEKDIPSDAKYICITIRYANQAKIFANYGNDPEARARFKALQDAVSYRFESSPTVKTLTSISATKTQTSYDIGDTLSTSDIVVTAHYSDNTSADVTSSAIIDTSDVNMSAQGTYSIAISYTEDGITQTTSIPIFVGEIVDNYDFVYGHSQTTDDGTTIVAFADDKRITAVTQTPNAMPVNIRNTSTQIGYMIPVPPNATAVTVRVSSGYVVGIRLITSGLTDDYNLGWSSENVATVTFMPNRFSYMPLNIRNSGNTTIPSDVDTSSWSIEFTYAENRDYFVQTGYAINTNSDNSMAIQKMSTSRAAILNKVQNTAEVKGYTDSTIQTNATLGYLIPVPSTATSVTVYLPSDNAQSYRYIAGVGFWNIQDGVLKRVTDMGGWGSETTTTKTFTAGAYQYMNVNIKNSADGELSPNAPINDWTITFE